MKTAEEWTGHEHGCDCGVCDDITFRRSLQKGFMSIAEVNEHEKLLRDELDEALGKIARLQVDLHQTVVDCETLAGAVLTANEFRGIIFQHSAGAAIMIENAAITAREVLADRP